MRQIRARIREKRGVDYTEEEIRELANVKLEKFIDPKGVRSEPARGVPPRQHARAAGAQLRLRRGHAVRNPPRPDSLAAIAVPPVPQALLQSQPADPGAAHPVGAEPEERRAERPPGAARRAALRSDSQPGRRADADRHRGQEPEDAARIDGQPPRLRRAPRPRPRRGRAVSSGRGPAAAAADGTGSAAPRSAAAPRPGGPSARPARSTRSARPAAADAVVAAGSGCDGRPVRLTRQPPHRRTRWITTATSAVPAGGGAGDAAVQVRIGLARRAGGRQRGAARLRRRGRRRASLRQTRRPVRQRRHDHAPEHASDLAPRASDSGGAPIRRRLTAPNREAGDRRSALRRGYQRRRRTARAIYRRASLAARRRRSGHDVRARLRDLEERSAGRRRADQRRDGTPLPGRARAQAARLRPPLAAGVRPTALDRRRARLARERGAGESGVDRARRAGRARPRLRHPLQLPLPPCVASGAARAGQGHPRPDRRTRSRRSACRSSAPSSAACARSCTTRRRSAP